MAEVEQILPEPTGEIITISSLPEGTAVTEGDKPILPQIPFSFPGQTFDTKCQKLILNVWDFFKRVKKNPDLLDEIRTPQERAAAALHVSAATIGKIGKNLKRTGKLETPGKKRKRTRPIVDSVDAFDEDVIRTIIQEMKSNKVTPTLPMVLSEARQKISFTGGATSFRRILQRMGYKNLSQKCGPPKNKSGTPGGVIGIKSQKTNRITNSNLNSTMTNIASSISNQHQTTQVVTANVVNANMVQVATGQNGEAVAVQQATAAAIASAAQASNQQPQTVHVIQPDNTVQQIQIVYAQL